jgi:viologen exporter family transport system permease protein
MAGARPRPDPIRAARLAWLFFRIGAMNELQYRVNFFVQLFQSLLALGVGVAVLALVFSHTGELAGWSQPQLLAVMGVHILVGGLIRSTIQPNMTRLMEDVQKGTLDYALTKPEDSQVLVSVREVRIWQAVDVLVGLIVLGVAVAQLEGGVGPWDALGFGAALILGGVTIYCFFLILTSLAFWVVRVHETVELFEGIYQAGRWPVGIYPGWLKGTLTFLVPLAFAVTVPAQAITSRLRPGTLLLAAGFAVALVAVTRWFWHVGLRRYSGASA